MTHEEALKTLNEKLTAAGHTWENGQVDGVYVNIDCREEAVAGSWRYTKNGKIRFTVGGYGNKTQFPQTKDGGFNWDKIVKQIECEVAQTKAQVDSRAKAEAKRAQADVECDQLRATNGLQKYSGKVRVSPCDYGIELVVSKGITKEQADALIKAAKACGLLD